MEPADSIITADWVVPVEPHDTVLTDHAIVVRDGLIEAILPTRDAEARYQPEQRFDRPGHVITPGLINAHTHSPMGLLRGMADDLPLMTWLTEHMWPAEQANVSSEYVQQGSELAIAEMLRGGTTLFSDMYFFPEATARAARRAGMRAAVGMIMIDFASPYGDGPEDYIQKGLALHDEWRDDPMIQTLFTPHAPYSVANEYLERLRTLADELEVPVHTHVHETAQEVSDGEAANGERPIASLERLGLLNSDLIAVHMTQLTDDEIQRVAACGASVVHCPESNLKLASGFCPVKALMDAGINVALGTDGAASNNDLDMIGEMRTAALLAKGVSADPAAASDASTLRMATLNGARALGLQERIGSLVPGKEADLIAVDLNAPATQPVYNPISQLIYAAGRDQVQDSWIAGQHVLNRGRLTTVDSDIAIRQAQDWRDKIRG
jgi:5-methylthioadenosine/S-adenosylhomocysteine deaminase